MRVKQERLKGETIELVLHEASMEILLGIVLF